MISRKIGLEELNNRYADLSPEQRLRQIYGDFDPEKILVTSSFGTSSILLLDLMRRINPQQEVHFINTGYHFSETLAYKRRLIQLFDLKIVDLLPSQPDHQFTTDHQTWLSDPDLCCSLNKVKPMDLIRERYDLWISGLYSQQTSDRRNLNYFEDKGDIVKFYPVLDLSSEQVEKHIIHHNLPVHPLKFMGYDSVGCTHCTVPGTARSGRWVGQDKTECGLHAG